MIDRAFSLAAAPAPALSGTAGYLLAGGVLLLLLVTWSSLRRKIIRNASTPRPTPSERVQQLRADAKGRDSLDQVMVSAEELSRRLAAHLDAKAARIEKLLEEANRAIAELDKRTGGAAPQTARRPSAFDPPAHDSPASDPALRKIYRLADEGHAPIEIAKRLDEQVGKVELVLALRSP